MTYAPTTWVDDTGTGNGTVINAARLNNLESGIVAAAPIGEGALQSGVLTAADCALTVDSASQVSVSAGVVYVTSAAGVLVRTAPAAAVFPFIPPCSATNFRVDVVMVDVATGALGYQLATSQGTGVNLTNRGTAYPLGPGTRLLYDILVSSAGVLAINVRDRRPWARGGLARYLSTTDNTLNNISTSGNELVGSRLRLECTGNPVIAHTRALGNQTSGFGGRVGIWVDGALHTGANGGGNPLGGAGVGAWSQYNYTFLLENVPVGSRLFSLAFYSGSGTGTFSVAGGVNDPISLILREQVAGVANNGTS